MEDVVVGMTVEMILCGDCVGAGNGSTGGLLVGGVVDTMFVVMTVTGLSDVVSLSSTAMCFVTVTDTVGVTIIKLRELEGCISERVVLP